MDIVTKKQLNILIQLAEADKHFAKSEREMIFKIARERGFPEDVVLDLIRSPESIGSLGALSEEQKFQYLKACIELIFADQKLFESELIFCRGIAIKLGFKKNVVDFMVKERENLSMEQIRSRIFSEYL